MNDTMNNSGKLKSPPALASSSAETVRTEVAANRKNWDPQYARVVHDAMDEHDAYVKEAELAELESRRMWRSDAQLSLRLVLLEGSSAKQQQQQQQLLVDVSDAITFSDLRTVVRRRCGLSSDRFRLLWLTASGDTVVLDQKIFRQYVLANWCQPWTVCVHDEGRGPLEAILLCKRAKVLFERYDVNANGRVEKAELLRLFQDLSLESLNCSGNGCFWSRRGCCSAAALLPMRCAGASV